MDTKNSTQGFSLLELLIALMLVTLMLLGIAQYLTFSYALNQLMRQETLAAQALESLILQAGFSSTNQQLVSQALHSQTCPQTTYLDFSAWCQALALLPELEVRQGATNLILSWQGPKGLRQLIRPKWIAN